MNEISESIPQGERGAEDEEDEGMASEPDSRIRSIEETIRDAQRDSKDLPKHIQQITLLPT